MSEKIADNEGHVFGMSSSYDLYEKLKYESERLKDGWHHYDAFNFLVTAWHLYEDWLKNEDKKLLCKQKRNPNKLSPQMRMVLNTVRDLTNGSKHFKLTDKYKNKSGVSKIHSGCEGGSWYSFLFHEKMYGVTVEDNSYFSIRLLNDFIMRYYQWVYDDTVPVESFPQELNAAILWCNIANRNAGSAPALYLKSMVRK